MTDQPAVPMRGAIDLSSLVNPPAPASGQEAPAPGGLTVELTEATFEAVATQSAQVPVVVYLWAAASPASVELKAVFERLAADYGGRFVLATADIQAQPVIAQAFQVQAVPSVLALIGGRPAPLFQGSAPEEQIREILDQVLDVAAENGVTGTVAASEPEPAAEPQPEPLPPLHQEAFDAIERDDLDGAEAAYRKALGENPRDADARAGLAQVGLMQRTRGKDLQQVRQAAADKPADVEAQLAVADMDILGGKVEDAFARLIDLVAALPAGEREPVRLRLVDLFEVVGSDDPRVGEARRALSAALF